MLRQTKRVLHSFSSVAFIHFISWKLVVPRRIRSGSMKILEQSASGHISMLFHQFWDGVWRLVVVCLMGVSRYQLS